MDSVFFLFLSPPSHTTKPPGLALLHTQVKKAVKAGGLLRWRLNPRSRVPGRRAHRGVSARRTPSPGSRAAAGGKLLPLTPTFSPCLPSFPAERRSCTRTPGTSRRRKAHTTAHPHGRRRILYRERSEDLEGVAFDMAAGHAPWSDGMLQGTARGPVHGGSWRSLTTRFRSGYTPARGVLVGGISPRAARVPMCGFLVNLAGMGCVVGCGVFSQVESPLPPTPLSRTGAWHCPGERLGLRR
jgi:hypothetical protein